MTVKNFYPWGTFLMDATTGLPQLPEGEFWRVTKPLLGLGAEVHRRKKTWYGSKKLAWTTTNLSRTDIQNNAAYILWKKSNPDNSRSLIGDYPPKKL